MDDLYLIHADKAHLQFCLAEIKTVCTELKINVNEKKTRIVTLSAGVSFLKGTYRFLESGRILYPMHKDNAKRMRRKLFKFKRLIDAGKMEFEDLWCAYLVMAQKLSKML